MAYPMVIPNHLGRETPMTSHFLVMSLLNTVHKTRYYMMSE